MGALGRYVQVMPCFDKKLEASRDDFKIGPEAGGGGGGGSAEAGETTQEVDCVLTTGEVAEMIAAAVGAAGDEGEGTSSALAGAAALASIPPAALDGWLASAGGGDAGASSRSLPLPSMQFMSGSFEEKGDDGGGDGGGGGDVEMSSGDVDMPDRDMTVDYDNHGSSTATTDGEWLWGPDTPGGSGGSGGYLDTVFRHAAWVLHGVRVEGPLQYKVLCQSGRDLLNPNLKPLTITPEPQTIYSYNPLKP